MAIAAAGSAAKLWVCPPSQRSWEPGIAAVERLNNLTPAAGERREEGNMAVIDR